MKKYVIVKGDHGLSLSKDAIQELMPEASSIEEVNSFFNTRRSDEKLIEYVEKHGRNAFHEWWQVPEIVQVSEDQNFTHEVVSSWDSYNDCPEEELEVIPIVRKSMLDGKTPEEIIQYLQDIGVSFVEGM